MTAQLGRPPRGDWWVEKRCACGMPQVITTTPSLNDGTPFPTMWWLTCRALGSAVSRLESEGWMGEVNERLSTDPGLRRSLQESTTRYIEVRDAMVPLGRSEHPGGGPDHVKCLHAHVAHELASGDNPVGEAVLRELSWRDPQEPCV